jgi:hypothetical protein
VSPDREDEPTEQELASIEADAILDADEHIRADDPDHAARAYRGPRGWQSPSDAIGAGQCDDSEDWHTEFKRTPTVWSFTRRQSVRSMSQSVHDLIVKRMAACLHPSDSATRHGIVLEIRAVSAAERCGTPDDVAAAWRSVAASAVLLAEAADPPPEPKRGARRATTSRWAPLDFSISDGAVNGPRLAESDRLDPPLAA